MIILHLSDIHFRKSEIETAQDPNAHLRNELLRDIERESATLGPPDVIIISGDVAFGGHPDEFSYATRWLNDVCAVSGGTMASVFVCPGNHDVVRTKADSTLVQHIHESIKRQPDITLDDYLRRQILDPDVSRLLYESIDNYNEFALQFFCDLLPPNRTIAKRTLTLNDGSALRISGLNTSFLSSSFDREGDIFVDPASFQITRDYGVVNLVVAHHHLSWIRQRRSLEDHLNDVAPVQIFGHIHTNRIDMNVDYVRLTASAAHPDRREANWEPGYNLIELSVAGEGAVRRLNVRAHVRVWQTAPGGFRAKRYKGSDVFETQVPLEAWAPAIPIRPDASALVDERRRIVDDASSDSRAEGRMMAKLRDVGLRFYQLSFSKKSEIAGKLELLEAEDMSQPDFERFRRVFQRAHDRGKLDQLAEAVRAAGEG